MFFYKAIGRHLVFIAKLDYAYRVAVRNEADGSLLLDDDIDVQEPEEYRVILLNDDFTTMDFVVAILMSVFHKALDEAMRIMLDVHKKGSGFVGVYSYDIAATKIHAVHQRARENGFPLKCIMEKV